MSTIDEIEQRLAAATPGPWFRHDIEDALTEYGTVTHAEVWTEAELDARTSELITEDVSTKADAALIAHAPADLGALVKFAREVEALHRPMPNSSSALYPTPLCACGEEHPCPTVQALQRLDTP